MKNFIVTFFAILLVLPQAYSLTSDDETLYIGEFKITIENNYSHLSIAIDVDSVGVVWDNNYHITESYPGGDIVSDQTGFDFSLDHVSDYTPISPGIIGYGLYKTRIYIGNSLKITVYADYRDCNYKYGTIYTNDIHFVYDVSTDILKESGVYSSANKTMSNGDTVHIWDNNNHPSGSPNTSKFQPTTVTGLYIVNDNNAPRIYWKRSTPTNSARYYIYRGGSIFTTNSIYDTTYRDNSVSIGGQFTFDYKIRAVNGALDIYATDYSETCSIQGGNSLEKNPINGNKNDVLTYELTSNYPNPFNPSTTISYTIPEYSFVDLTLFNAAGIEILKLVHQYESAGAKSVHVDCTTLPSGVYYYRMIANNFSTTQRMTLIK